MAKENLTVERWKTQFKETAQRLAVALATILFNSSVTLFIVSSVMVSPPHHFRQLQSDLVFFIADTLSTTSAIFGSLSKRLRIN